ncbi:hypothetical protein CXG81DRAFT_17268 [Caulochytrium protostelioides]|uniref:Cwf19-like C-terminal domain-containing protein n=1 Tax=Caulochytrium protostelioides TaxID=1555241 RepID=A0A4P9XCQ7_9FUNG|nr:hypothetical protein CXG81DRAFT_17268 [Caulochytrium protostelioides]|eukprot:RKP03212.1 hypothetical protein CXG81DRAFT_17268 [Caulochytrium protostelioides]
MSASHGGGSRQAAPDAAARPVRDSVSASRRPPASELSRDRSSELARDAARNDDRAQRSHPHRRSSRDAQADVSERRSASSRKRHRHDDDDNDDDTHRRRHRHDSSHRRRAADAPRDRSDPSAAERRHDATEGDARPRRHAQARSHRSSGESRRDGRHRHRHRRRSSSSSSSSSSSLSSRSCSPNVRAERDRDPSKQSAKRGPPEAPPLPPSQLPQAVLTGAPAVRGPTPATEATAPPSHWLLDAGTMDAVLSAGPKREKPESAAAQRRRDAQATSDSYARSKELNPVMAGPHGLSLEEASARTMRIRQLNDIEAAARGDTKALFRLALQTFGSEDALRDVVRERAAEQASDPSARPGLRGSGRTLPPAPAVVSPRATASRAATATTVLAKTAPVALPTLEAIAAMNAQLNMLNGDLLRAQLTGDGDAAAITQAIGRLTAQRDASAQLRETTVLPHVASTGRMASLDVVGDGAQSAVPDGAGRRGHRRRTQAPDAVAARDADLTIAELALLERTTDRDRFDREFAAQLGTLPMSGRGPDLELMDDQANALAARTVVSSKQQRQAAINDYQKLQRILETCDLCKSLHPAGPAESASRAPGPVGPRVIAQGAHVVLAVPHGVPYSPFHCLIYPREHTSSLLRLDEDAWQEVRNFQKCLIRMADAGLPLPQHNEGAAADQASWFAPSAAPAPGRRHAAHPSPNAAYLQDVSDVAPHPCSMLFIECTISRTPLHLQHAVMIALPVPPAVADDAPVRFREGFQSLALADASATVRVMPTTGSAQPDPARTPQGASSAPRPFRDTLVPDLPYFHVWLGFREGLAHVLETTSTSARSGSQRRSARGADQGFQMDLLLDDGDLGGEDVDDVAQFTYFWQEVLSEPLGVSPFVYRQLGSLREGGRRAAIRTLTTRELDAQAALFAKYWKPFDWTLPSQG